MNIKFCFLAANCLAIAYPIPLEPPVIRLYAFYPVFYRILSIGDVNFRMFPCKIRAIFLRVRKSSV